MITFVNGRRGPGRRRRGPAQTARRPPAGGHLLGIRRETDYAVRTMLHLASLDEGESVSVRDVAQQRLLPLSFVRRIVARLSGAGLLTTTRGMGGGIRLARPPADITLLDVVRVMEDDLSLNSCLEPGHTCPLSAGCPAQRVWADASAVLERHLAGVNFAALSAGDRHVSAHRRLQRSRPLPAAPRKRAR